MINVTGLFFLYKKMLTQKQLDHIAKLSALNINNEEKDKFLSQLENIISFISSLKEVDVEGVEPLYHPLEEKNLNMLNGTEKFENIQGIMANISHHIQNNGIVIKSAIK